MSPQPKEAPAIGSVSPQWGRGARGCGRRSAGHDHAGDHLAKHAAMTTQISDFLKSYPGPAAVADHINQFWTKRMREEFRTGFETDALVLSPRVR